ncbi:MAG: Crp/Fnr family transcriptional regulator [Pyrinomonadaceae bacterium]
MDRDKLKNFILRNLSDLEFREIKERLEKLEMKIGDILYHPLEKTEYVYFPETGVISVVMVLENGETIESGIIGREGFSGAAVILSEDVSPQELTIQLTGECFRLPVNDYKSLFDKNKKFREAALYHIYAFIAQISQNAACLCHHNTDQRLARWFLMFADRAEKNELDLTQEFISQMLGVHRPTVSKNAGRLQQLGFISYNRGLVKILDRTGLENFTCECYRMIRQRLRTS